MKTNRIHATVVGGSMAGLIAARVLSNHFEKVTIIEKDIVNNEPETRKGQSQTKHIHLLLVQAMNTLSHYFPDLKEELLANGALELDVGNDYNWYSYGGIKKKGKTGITALTMSRPLLEYHVKKGVVSMGNIVIQDNTKVKEIHIKNNVVRALSIEKEGKREELKTDFIVDASGRGSKSFKWLKQHGYEIPQESKIKIDITYVTVLFKRKKVALGQKLEVISYSPEAPKEKLGVVMMPIEDDRWVLTLIGMRGAIPPQNDQELIMFLKKLPIKGIYDIVSETDRLTEFMVYKYPNSVRRHYEKLKNFPGSYIVLGDTISSFNPMYAQGMASSIFQAKILDEVLGQITSNDHIFKPYISKVTKIIEALWTAGAYEDFKYPETEGKKPIAANLVNNYMKTLQKAANNDAELFKEILEVAGFLKPGMKLFRPKILWKVFRKNL